MTALYRDSKYVQLTVSLSTVWTFWGSVRDGGEVFRTLTDYHRGPPNLQYIGHRYLSKGKSAGSWCSLLILLALRLKKSTAIPVFHLCVFVAGSNGELYFTYTVFTTIPQQSL